MPGLAAVLFTLGACFCYEEDTEYAWNWHDAHVGTRATTVTKRERVIPVFSAAPAVPWPWEPAPLERKWVILPFCVGGEPEWHAPGPYRVRVVERYYLFGLISTKTKFGNYSMGINIKPPTT
jgi:hypothetical protein